MARLADEIVDILAKVDTDELDKAEQQLKELQKKFKVVDIKLDVEDGELDAIVAKLKEFENKFKRIEGKLTLDDKELEQTQKLLKDLNKDLDVIEGTVKVNDDQLKDVQENIDKLNNTVIRPKIKPEGLDETNRKLTNAQKLMTGLGTRMLSASTGLKSMSSTLNIMSASLQNIGNNAQMIGRLGVIAGATIGGATIKGLKDLTLAGIKGTINLEGSKAQLKAQGITGAKLEELLPNMRDFARKTSFSLTNLVGGTSAVNAYVGNIDKAYEATRQFGISLMASGRSAEELARVAPNLGQLSGKNFDKKDYKELLQGVPAMSQALRDQGIKSWEEFNIALGDNPATKTIERTGNALDLVTDAITKFNIKTNAMEESMKPLGARFDNFKETISDILTDTAQESGLTDSLRIMMDNLQEGFEKNIPMIESFYRWLGKTGVSASEMLRDFDFQSFFNGLRKGFDDFKDSVESTIKWVNDLVTGLGFKGFGESFKDFRTKFTEVFQGGAEGAEGFGRAISNAIGSGFKLYTSGILIKGVSSVLSLLSTTAGVAGNVSESMGKILLKRSNRLGRTPKNQDSISDLILGTYNDTKTPIKTSIDKPIETAEKAIAKSQLKIGGLKEKLKGLSFSGVGKSALKGVGTVASNMIGLGQDIALITLAVKGFSSLPSAGTIASGFTKIGAVTLGMSAINIGTGVVSKMFGVSQAMSALSNLLNAGTIMVASRALRSMQNLPSAKEIGSGFLKISAFTAGATALSTVKGLTAGTTLPLELIGSIANGLSGLSVSSLAKAMKNLKGLPEANEVATSMDKLKIFAKSVTELSNAIDVKFWKSFKNRLSTSNIVKVVDNLAKMTKNIQSFSDVELPSNEKILEIIKSIRFFSEHLDFGLITKDQHVTGTDYIKKASDNITSTIESLVSLTNVAKKLPTTETIEAIQKSIQEVVNAVSHITIYGRIQDPKDFKSMSGIMGSVKSILSNMNAINASLTAIQDSAVNSTKVATASKESVRAMVSAVNELYASFSSQMGMPGFFNKMSSTLFGAKDTGGLNISASGMNTLDKMLDTIKTTLSKVQQLDTILMTIQSSKVKAEQVKSSIKGLMQALQAIITEFSSPTTGTVTEGLGDNKLTNKISEVQAFVDSVKQAIDNLSTVQPVANQQGVNLANETLKGWESGAWSKRLRSPIVKAMSGFNQIGSSAGSKLKVGFNAGTRGMSNQVIAEVNQIKTALFSIPNAINVNVSAQMSGLDTIMNNINKLKIKASTGGYIGMSYFSTGGSVGSTPFGQYAHGTDKIPAMLTQGEYVQNRNAVSFWGRGMMEALNTRNVDRVSQLMQSRIAQGNRSYVNNTYHNTNAPTVNQTFNGGASKQYMNLNRLVRGV